MKTAISTSSTATDCCKLNILTKEIVAARRRILTSRSSNCSNTSTHSDLPEEKTEIYYKIKGNMYHNAHCSTKSMSIIVYILARLNLLTLLMGSVCLCV